MKLSILASSLALALSIGAPALLAQQGPAPDAPKTDLEKQMDIIGRGFRSLSRAVSDSSKNDASIATVAKMRDAALAADKLTPKLNQEKPVNMDDFHKGIKDLVASFDKLSADLKAGDNTAAAADLKQIHDIEETNHKEFRKPEPRAGGAAPGAGGPPPPQN